MERFFLDVLIQAKSGTGKTLVFVIAALEYICESPDGHTIILVPTREIAVQIVQVINSIALDIPGKNKKILLIKFFIFFYNLVSTFFLKIFDCFKVLKMFRNLLGLFKVIYVCFCFLFLRFFWGFIFLVYFTFCFFFKIANQALQDVVIV